MCVGAVASHRAERDKAASESCQDGDEQRKRRRCSAHWWQAGRGIWGSVNAAQGGDRQTDRQRRERCWSKSCRVCVMNTLQWAAWRLETGESFSCLMTSLIWRRKEMKAVSLNPLHFLLASSSKGLQYLEIKQTSLSSSSYRSSKMNLSAASFVAETKLAHLDSLNNSSGNPTNPRQTLFSSVVDSDV